MDHGKLGVLRMHGPPFGQICGKALQRKAIGIAEGGAGVARPLGKIGQTANGFHQTVAGQGAARIVGGQRQLTPHSLGIQIAGAVYSKTGQCVRQGVGVGAQPEKQIIQPRRKPGLAQLHGKQNARAAAFGQLGRGADQAIGCAGQCAVQHFLQAPGAGLGQI